MTTKMSAKFDASAHAHGFVWRWVGRICPSFQCVEDRIIGRNGEQKPAGTARFRPEMAVVQKKSTPRRKPRNSGGSPRAQRTADI